MAAKPAFNMPASTKTFAPKQALSPTPALYDELIGDCGINLAIETMKQIPIPSSGSIIHDNGCGTGYSTKGIMSLLSSSPSPTPDVKIVGTDISTSALELYSQKSQLEKWPASTKEMDSMVLAFEDETFTHSLSSALVFVLPEDGVPAVKETYRTLKPGGVALFNSWAYIPNMKPIQMAAENTRPAGIPLPRQGLEKWSEEEVLRKVVEEGGFESAKVKILRSDVMVETNYVLQKYAMMLWSFVGGTGEAGWLEEDEENWDRAVGMVVDEFRKTDGFEELEDGRVRLRFVANIAVAVK